MSIFSERLKRLRAFHNVTQAQLAKEVGITDRACRRYEAGENEPTLSVIESIADFFNVPADYLLGRDGFLRTKDGGFWVEVPPDIFGKSEKELAEMINKAKKNVKKKSAIRLKAEPSSDGNFWGDDEEDSDED